MPFPLLNLPREIRDAIYTYTILAWNEVVVPQGLDENDTKIWISNVLNPNLLRVSRQIRAEYHDTLPHRRKSIVVGANSDYWTSYPDLEPSLAHTIDDCTTFIHVHCLCDNMTDEERQERQDSGIQCDGADFLENYQEALMQFLRQFPNLRHIHLQVAVYGSDEEDSRWRTKDLKGRAPQLGHTSAFRDNLEYLVGLPLAVESLTLFKCRSPEDYAAVCEAWLHDFTKSSWDVSEVYASNHDFSDIYASWTRYRGWQAGPALTRPRAINQDAAAILGSFGSMLG